MSRMLSVVLLGNSAVGKRSSGNTILGRQVFVSRSSLRPVTTKISEAMEQVHGRQVSVVDTPGILNPNALDTIRRHCQEVLCSSRPCLFLVVLKVDRVSAEQVKALETTIEVLGAEGMQHSLLLFTFGDSLGEQSLEDFICEDDEGPLPDIVSMFGGRHHVFNNKARGQEQVLELLQKFDQLQTGLTPGPVRPRAQRGAVSHQQLTLTPEFELLDLQPPPTIEQMRLVLLGLPGAGKSSSGNTILRSDQFRTSCGFNSVSIKADVKTAPVLGRKVTVVDTPGFSDEGLKPKKLFKQIMKSVMKLAPGVHAFIIVVRIGRVSKRDTELLELMPKLFDKVASKFTMVLFTHGDDLRNENIKNLIEANPTMKRLMENCKQRYTVFNNKKRDSCQVEKLFRNIETMVQESGEVCCTSRIFKLKTEEIREFIKMKWAKVKLAFINLLSRSQPVKNQMNKDVHYTQLLEPDEASSSSNEDTD